MADAPDRARSGRPGTLPVLTAVLAVGSIAWVVASVERPWGAAVLGWIAAPTGGALTAVACWRTAGTAALAPPARRFWRTLGLAEVLLCVAALAHAWYSPDSTRPMASPVIALYLVGAATALVALLRLPTAVPLSGADRSRWGLDALIVLSTTGLFAWHLSFRRLPDQGWRGNSPVLALAIVLVTAVAVLAFGKLALAGQRHIERTALRLLAAGMLVGAVGGALAPLLMRQPHLTSAQFGLPLSACLYALAAERQRTVAGRPPPPPRRPRRPRRPFSVVPYAAVTATGGLLLSTARDGGREAFVVAAGATWLTAVVVVRQIAAFYENARLLARVDSGLAELRRTQSQLAHQATHDALTGLANRQLFGERVGRAVAAGEPCSVVLIDLDDFKAVNDRLGHVVGDEVLVAVARRLATSLKRDDTIARLGGDEFALLLCGVDGDGAATVMARVARVLDQPIRVGEYDLLVRSSVGIAGSWPGADPTELLRRADLAMYAAKDRGKGRCASYQPGLDARTASDAQLAADLRRALDRGEFHLRYQPVVELPDGRLGGAEALVRWRHPGRMTVPPELFIPAAEQSGLIVPLGAWILREACRQAVEWLRGPGGDQPWRIGVNISARQLREPGFAADVAECLREAGLPPDRLVVEVTETAVFDNDRAVGELTALAAFGVAVALDDFGTGHSSLGLLRTCPVNVLKVDRSFVESITTTDEAAVIARALIALADGLGLRAVAEGVETEAQARALYELGYRWAQGFHFAPPMTGDELGRLIAAQRPRPGPAPEEARNSSPSGPASAYHG